MQLYEMFVFISRVNSKISAQSSSRRENFKSKFLMGQKISKLSTLAVFRQTLCSVVSTLGRRVWDCDKGNELNGKFRATKSERDD